MPVPICGRHGVLVVDDPGIGPPGADVAAEKDRLGAVVHHPFPFAVDQQNKTAGGAQLLEIQKRVVGGHPRGRHLDRTAQVAVPPAAEVV